MIRTLVLPLFLMVPISALPIPRTLHSDEGSSTEQPLLGNSPSSSDRQWPPSNEELEYFANVTVGIITPESHQIFDGQQKARFESEMVECMSASGLSYIVNPTADPADSDTLEWVQTFGFGLAVSIDPDSELNAPAHPDQDNSPLNDLDPAEAQRYFETLEACAPTTTAISYRIIYDSDWAAALDGFWKSVELDTRVETAHAGWRTCMNDRGYQYRDPDELVAELYKTTNLANLEDLQKDAAWRAESSRHQEWLEMVDSEIALAVATFQCNDAVDQARIAAASDRRDILLQIWESLI